LFSEEGSTLVFPTENTARYYLSEFARERRCSIRASRAMAFDEFAALFAPHHEDRRPANKYHRLAFISSLLESGRSGLSYLYRDECSSYFQRFVPFLSQILPSLEEMDGARIRSHELYCDLLRLKDLYSEYLEENSLFEPGWERHSTAFCTDFPIDHILVGADVEIPMIRLMEELGPVDGLKKLCLSEVRETKYELYQSEEAELEVLFRRLLELKKQGQSIFDIILSTPDIEYMRPRLERKGREYGIPLVFMTSLKFIDTVPGRFLLAIRRCSTENLSFHSLEALLLDTSFPYTDIERNRALVRFMIDHNIQSGSLHYGRKDELFMKLAREKSSLIEFYKAFKGSLSSLCSAQSGPELVSSLHGMCTLLFGKDEFRNGSDEDRDVYSFLISELDHFGRVLKESGMKITSLFSLFMNDAEKLSYVSQEKREGIPVYTYGQDYLMDVKYRFVFGLNDSSYRRELQVLSFLDDREIEHRKGYSTTDALVAYYQSTAARTHISGSLATYEGTVDVPSYFILKELVEEVDSIGPEGYGSGLERSLAAAGDRVFRKRGVDIATSDEGGFGRRDKKGYHFSYSSLSKYVQCPYKAFLELELVSEKEVPDDFEPSKQDDAYMGSFLHSVIQTFMENHKDELVTIDHMEEYGDEIAGILDSKLAEDRVFDEYTKRSMKGVYIEPLKGAVLYMLQSKTRSAASIGPFVPKANELQLTDEVFTGLVDTVLEDRNGRVYLIDYKKGDAPVTYQLVLYKELYEKTLNRSVENVFFYSMHESYLRGIAADRLEELSDRLAEDYERTEKGYREGLWKATPGKKNCENCSERGICRRRYNLQ